MKEMRGGRKSHADSSTTGRSNQTAGTGGISEKDAGRTGCTDRKTTYPDREPDLGSFACA